MLIVLILFLFLLVFPLLGHLELHLRYHNYFPINSAKQHEISYLISREGK